MKKIYERPQVVVETFSNEDIITVSGGIVIGNFKNENKGENLVSF